MDREVVLVWILTIVLLVVLSVALMVGVNANSCP